MTYQPKSQNLLDHGTTVGPQIYRILRARIISNEMEPGIRISESEIASEYDVSRQPVREAFIKLAEEGLLEVRPQRGTFVRKITVSAVMDARFVREAIEADIARYLAANASDATISKLRNQIADQRAALDNPQRFMELDDIFHATLAEAAGKARVWRIVEGLKSQMDRVRHLSMLRFPAPKLVSQHAAIVEAIASHDTEGAVDAMRGHLQEILNDLPEIAKGRPEFFEERP